MLWRKLEAYPHALRLLGTVGPVRHQPAAAPRVVREGRRAFIPRGLPRNVVLDIVVRAASNLDGAVHGPENGARAGHLLCWTGPVPGAQSRRDLSGFPLHPHGGRSMRPLLLAANPSPARNLASPASRPRPALYRPATRPIRSEVLGPHSQGLPARSLEHAGVACDRECRHVHAGWLSAPAPRQRRSEGS